MPTIVAEDRNHATGINATGRYATGDLLGEGDLGVSARLIYWLHRTGRLPYIAGGAGLEQYARRRAAVGVGRPR